MGDSPQNATDSGASRLEVLESLRIRLQNVVDDRETSPAAAALAQVSRELRLVMSELESLTVAADGVEVSGLDDLTARRAARRSDTNDHPSTARRSQPRRRGGSDRAG